MQRYTIFFKKLHYPMHLSWIISARNMNASKGDLYMSMKTLENGILLKPTTVDKLCNDTCAIGLNES